ncbi:SIR2 family protein [Stenotrophomonas maltophilia]|uniref:SIR2 family protein n=1 Tax=Stenotrophomonas maltophilia TaxID=40324 RepID=UPI0021C8187B|nr:SIR2 family protein [Stenotrophomonas maltophilia]MCU1128416.1 SIR2 family protein [Stenotrophomonas maltophilia]
MSVSVLQQLEGKRRSYEDLSRFMGAHTGGVPNYALLLGAGCSVSSGVRSAAELTEIWRQEVFKRHWPNEVYEPEVAKTNLTKSSGGWYNPIREYSSLFEKNFDLPRQRRIFVETEVSGKSPNLGYAYLMRLVDKGFLNTIFTTNFDDLVNEAFFQFSDTRPMLCAHDSSISSITITSKRPKVIKLHGDYLFDDIKSTVRETESLEENTRKKFIEFGREFGLVVVGYSGGDRSIMDVLHYLLRSEDYFKHGIYWCLRKGDEPGDELLKLLWRERVYFVEIDGFDEVMASLHNDLIGDSLPIDTSLITKKPKSIIERFCESKFLMNSSSEFIKRDLEKLRKMNEREEVLGIFRGLKKEDSEDSSDSLDDREFVTTMDVKRMIERGEFSSARERVSRELKSSPSRRFREDLLDLRVIIEDVSGNVDGAISAIDEMISADPKDANLFVRKTLLIGNHEERMLILDIAEEIDSFDVDVHSRRLQCLSEKYSLSGGADKDLIYKEIKKVIHKSLDCDPGPKNPIWWDALSFYTKSNLAKDQFRSDMDALLSRLEAMRPNSVLCLRFRLGRWSKAKEDRGAPEVEKLINDIVCAKSERPISERQKYEWLEMDAYRALRRNSELSRKISELEINPDFSDSPNFLRRKSDFLMEVSGDVNQAILSLTKAVGVKRRSSDVARLAVLYKYTSNGSAIADLADPKDYSLSTIERIQLKTEELQASGDLEGYLALLRSKQNQKRSEGITVVEETHALLLLRRFEEASKVAKASLDKSGWQKDAAALIVNYELAELKSGRTLNKRRIAEVESVCSNDLERSGCNYLLGNFEKSKSAFCSALRDNKEDFFVISSWAIFDDDSGSKFLDGLKREIGI